jgi:hypothetical protein
MEDWQLDFEWLQTRHFVKDTLALDKLPDLEVVLMLIGVQEFGQIKEEWTKEEKRDLMHIATCRLLSYDGFYEFEGIDADGWPHWKMMGAPPKQELKEQERYLKIKAIQYFKELQAT